MNLLNLLIAIMWLATAAMWGFAAAIKPNRSDRVPALLLCVSAGLLAAAYAGLWWSS